MLQRDPATQRLYAHDVVIAEESTSPETRHLSTDKAGNSGDKLFITDILQKALSVKRESTNSEKKSADNGKLSVKEETQQTQEAMANPDSKIRTPDGKHRVVYHGTSSKATPHDSARANPEKNQVPRKAIIHRNTMCIARKKDEVRVQFFQEAPMADCAVLP